MLELYYFLGATCGLKARLALSEKKLSYKHNVVDRKFLKTDKYRKLNPNGVVPTLIHNGSIILESSIIMNYVDDAFQGPPLKPGEPLDIARMSTWMKNADDVYLPSVGIVTYTVSMRHKVLQTSEDELEEYFDAIPDPARRERRRNSIELGMDSPEFAPALYALDGMLSDMETSLNQSEWLAGPIYTLADIALTPFLERLDELAFTAMWEEGRPAIADWWDRVRSRQSYDDVITLTPNPEGPHHKEKGKKDWPKIKVILTEGKPRRKLFFEG